MNEHEMPKRSASVFGVTFTHRNDGGLDELIAARDDALGRLRDMCADRGIVYDGRAMYFEQRDRGDGHTVYGYRYDEARAILEGRLG